MLAKVEIEMKFYSPLNVKFRLKIETEQLQHQEVLLKKDSCIRNRKSGTLEYRNPYLYKLILETENEVIVDHIALRKIEIKDQVIYLNGQKIKFRGVNRHDSDPVTGFTINSEQITTDLTLMKQHNLMRSVPATIRTHHFL